MTEPAAGRAPLVSRLQRGVRLRARVGISIRAFLGEGLGLPPALIARLGTVFLDGRPVDDLDGAILRGGATLALSGAMPGLAGATLRRGGPAAPLRSSITHTETGKAPEPSEGVVTLKCFNTAAEDVAPYLAAARMTDEPPAGDAPPAPH